MRPNNRELNQIRPVKITRHYTKYAEGSVLIEFGETKVLCNATIEETVPRFLKGQQQGWVTAEYGMLPRATHSHTTRSGKRQANRQNDGNSTFNRTLFTCCGRS